MNLRIPGLLAVAAAGIAGLIGSAQALHAQGTWSTLAPMPIAQSGATSGVINGQLYVPGGYVCGGDCFAPTVTEVYDPATNTWGSAAPIPTARVGLRAGAIGAFLYVAGGCLYSDCRIGTTNIVEAYDSATNSWTTKAAMPTPRSVFGTGVIGDLLYVVGGQGACPPCTPLNTLEVYNPVTNIWATLAPMPTARREVAAGVVNGVLYAVGGLPPPPLKVLST